MNTEQSKSNLRDLYSKIETKELIKLFERGTLTETARPILKNEIISRLRDRYSKMKTEELIELYQHKTLAEVAHPVLENEILSRDISTETVARIKIEKENRDNMNFYRKNIDFTWWVISAWLGLTIGNLYTFYLLRNMMVIAVALIVFNSVLMVLILKFNKYAFLTATIFSLNPIIWIINGIYLKRRWHHPKVNA